MWRENKNLGGGKGLVEEQFGFVSKSLQAIFYIKTV